MSVLASLCDGDTLMIGGKEVEVMGVISQEDFARGRCFQDFQVETSEPQAESGPQPSNAGRLLSKPFCPPTLLRGGHLGSRPKEGEEEETCKSRHDPMAPGSRTFARFLIYCLKVIRFPSKCIKRACVTPLPGALVMPRPSSNHQWSHNKSGLPVVDVVVDPHVNVHLRPHQREGLIFLYECVMGMR